MELTDKMQETRVIAVTEGVKLSALATAVVVGSHVGLSRYTSWYRSVPAAPRRILAALVILGGFSFGSHLSQANHVLENNRRAGMR